VTSKVSTYTGSDKSLFHKENRERFKLFLVKLRRKKSAQEALKWVYSPVKSQSTYLDRLNFVNFVLIFSR